MKPTTTNISLTLGNRLREILTEGTWVTGTNVLNEISSLTWKDATQKVHNLNTIADLTFHLHYYIAGVADVFEGGHLNIRDQFSFDAPPITSQEDWQQRIDLFKNDSKRFILLVENMSETTLFGSFVDKKYGSNYRNIDVIIEHTYYHLGQIVLIKKLLQQS